ncbi:hypothetical protein BDZ89DRAFT_946188 [Hymenopellis radicata]|nr:hypothetical protein BDZ89DRAFT_946188 [Hymenopellis radicata]
MCFRRLENTRHSCGHDITHGDHLVDCGSSACRYSSKHQANHHDCKNTCKQWLRPPQNVVTQTSGGPCYHCPALRN